MDGKSLMQKAINKCDLYFECELISKERLIQTYAQFIAETFAEKEHNISIVLHTGSICFDIISIVSAAISNLILNETDVDDILDALEINDIVLYGKERHIYKGIEEKDFSGKKTKYIILEQVRTDKTGIYHDKNYVPMRMAYKIQPYNGESKRMDGRGIRKDIKKRNDFISTVFDIKENEIPSLTNTSSVIVMPRELSDRIINNLEIHYGDDNTIKLLDIVTASYFTESDEYQYGGNPGKIEPTLKITSKVSVARELIVKRLENKITGFTAIGYNISASNTELPELINRRSLKYVYMSYHIDFEDSEAFIRGYEDANIFACTKDFLLSNTMPTEYPNVYTTELNKQVKNIINKEIQPIIIEASHTWEEYKTIKKTLHFIRKADINGEVKDPFIIQASSLLNLFVTAVFTMDEMESLILSNELDTNILSPQKRIEGLKNISDSFPNTLKEKAILIIDELKLMYIELKDKCKKAVKLSEYIYENKGKKIAIVVPKAYYETILHKTFSDKISEENIIVTTANKFDNNALYDGIIIVGDFKGKRFNTFKSKAASDISVLLYEFENKLFNYKMRQSTNIDKLLNSKSRIRVEIDEPVNPLYDVDDKDTCEINDVSDDLDLYLTKLNELAARNIIQRSTNEYSNVVDVAMIGTFVDGENVFFTKAYKAYVFDEYSEDVKEVGIEDLCSGDTLIFTRKDDFTKSIVDEVLENLLIMGLLNNEVQIAYDQSKYWKYALRNYMDENLLSYQRLAKDLSQHGSTKHAVTVRSWLQEDSHIVGPEDEESYVHIASLTKDIKMAADPKSYYNSCRIIRNERRRILKLIGKSIFNKLRGNQPEKDEILEAVYNNVEKLAIKMQLETINEVEDRLQAPVNMVNRPISE